MQGQEGPWAALVSKGARAFPAASRAPAASAGARQHRLRDERRAASDVLEPDAVSNASGTRNDSTTTFVDVLIGQNTTTFQNNSGGIPKLKNETTVCECVRMRRTRL